VHADIKPTNILVSVDNGAGMIADLGLARVRAVGDSTRSSLHGVRGTPLFMAPELRHGAPLSSACDVYSLALTVWDALVPGELFASVRSTTHDASTRIFDHVDAGGRPDASRVGHATLAAALSAAWVADPAARPPISALTEALALAVEAAGERPGSPATAAPPPPSPPPPEAAFKCEHVLRGHTNIVLSVCAVSGGRIVSASRDLTLRVWSLATGTCLKVLGGHTGGVYSVCALEGGAGPTRVVSASLDKTLRVWDVTEGKSLAVLAGHLSGVWGVCVAGARIVSASTDDHLRVWDAATGACEHVLEGHEGGVSSVAALDERRVASASWDRTLRIWDIVRGACERSFSGHVGGVYGVTVAPGGRLVSASYDETLRVWDAATGACEAVLKGHTDGVDAAAALDDGRIVSVRGKGLRAPARARARPSPRPAPPRRYRTTRPYACGTQRRRRARS